MIIILKEAVLMQIPYKYFTSKSFALIFLTIFFAISLLQLTVFAAETSSNLVDLQNKIDLAMHQRLPDYIIQYTGNTSALQSDINQVITNIFDLDDYLHYSSKSYSYSAKGYVDNVTITFSFSYWENQSQANLVDTTVDDILKNIITADMNDFQKEKAIHDWIVLNVSYDNGKTQHSAYAALVAPFQAVCQGYSLLGYKMLSKAGIPVRIIEGTANKEAHNWLQVQLDSTWYHLDITWDDPSPDIKGKVSYDFYNLTDVQMNVANHYWTKSYPKATSPFYEALANKIANYSSNSNFFNELNQTLDFDMVLPSNTASTSSDLSDAISNSIAKGTNSIKLRYLSSATLASDLKSSLSNNKNVSSYSYLVSDFTRTTTLGDVILVLQFTLFKAPNVSSSVSLPKSNTNSTSNSSSITTPVAQSSTKISSVSANTPSQPSSFAATVILKMDSSPEKLVATSPNKSNKIRSINWSSADSNIAKVGSDGIVRAVSPGTTIITALSSDGKLKAYIKIIVNK